MAAHTPPSSEPASSADVRLRVADLRASSPTRVLLEPDADARAALAATLGVLGLRKLRFEGTLTPRGAKGWELSATLGATVQQACIVTLDPVSTRIDTAVLRRFVPPGQLATPEAGSETEMPDDDSMEPLGEVIDLDAVMTEALALALPAYPRKDGAALGSAQYSQDGVAPMTDADARPFAGLAALKEKMRDTDPED